MYNSFFWINFDFKEEFSHYNRKFYYINKDMDNVVGPIKFVFLGENIINDVKYININVCDINNQVTSQEEVWDTRFIFTSKEEALEFISRGKTTIPQGPSFSDMKELMCSGYPWW